jgi:type I restriction-modification system DNA methylase subunit
MGLTKERAKKNLSKLIERFEREYSSGRIKEYNEEATKTSFIQPFLKEVLGWNVNDRDEVSPEEKISRGRVDYGLKVEGKTKIFVEAKPPKADLNKHIEQAVRYGYNRKGVPFVLLTDFEGLKLFDVTVKPDARNPLKGLKIDLQWNQYLQEFEQLWWLSKKSVLQGELDRLLRVKPKERVSVDKAILDDLKRWRESLAKDIFKNNIELFHTGEPEKNADYLREITQKVLDRIIFMRFCEDRRLVHFRSLKELFEERTDTVGTNTMVFLREEFRHYNIIFDSDLFRPQEWENSLAIDFKVMREIIEDTYHPYQFDVIPLEVLGNIYEQYLGYTIRLTDHQLKYELKPEVRKAGGVYYTPEYIVDYIVKNTVGKLLKELPPRKIKKLRILDPACGSGSFLIRAYEEMLNYYRNQKKVKSKSKEKQRQLKLRDKDAEPHLSIREKSQILREHIFGVDIDEQAVEVTKLSLMLKMLEGEHGMVHGRSILPMLDQNIKCGNSLISGDTLELKKYFGDDWYKVKPFNWDEELRKVMVGEGGFDVVIGNPPYVNAKVLVELFEAYRRYLESSDKYKTLFQKWDIYIAFVEKGLELIKKDTGLLSMIIPYPYIHQMYAQKSRELICNKFTILSIVDLSEWKIFQDAVVRNCIIVIRKRSSKDYKINILKMEKENIFYVHSEIPQRSLARGKTSIWNIDQTKPLFFPDDKFINLGDCCFVSKGMVLNADEVKAKGKFKKKDLISAVSSKIHTKKYIEGKDIDRYRIFRTQYLEWNTERVPNLISRPTFPELYECPKILVNKLGGIKATIDYQHLYCEQTIRVVVLFKYLRGIENKSIANSLQKYYRLDRKRLEENSEKINYEFLLGFLNSKLANYLLDQIRGKDNIDINPEYLKQLPIPLINISNPIEKKLHDDLVALVDVMMDLNKKIQSARGSKKEQIQRQIEKTDKEIDDLVYKLYGITEKERKIIEGVAV